MAVMREVSEHLGGLATVSFGLGIRREWRNGPNGPVKELHNEYYFIGKLGTDLTDHLNRAHAIYRQSVQDFDAKPANTKRRGGKA